MKSFIHLKITISLSKIMFRWFSLLFLLFISLFVVSFSSHAQQSSGPVNIKVDRLIVKAGTQYEVYLPSLEMHARIEKPFTYITSIFSANYDFNRKDLGFGLEHIIHALPLKPGFSVEDYIYFRSAFSDSTGVWRRVRGMRLSIRKDFSKRVVLEFEAKREAQKSPIRTGFARVESVDDRTVGLYLNYLRDEKADSLNYSVGYISYEQGFRFLGGDYFYTIISLRVLHRRYISKRILYEGEVYFRANVTDEESPYFFLGGLKSLRGYDNDEFWGKRKYLIRNQLGVLILPGFRPGNKNFNIGDFMLISLVDFGIVRGGANILGEKSMTDKVKIGAGGGIGATFNTKWIKDMSAQVIVASPVTLKSSSKIYVVLKGFFD